MERTFAGAGLIVLLSGFAFGQTSFEMADVHVSPPTRNPFLRGPSIQKGRYEIRQATMVDLIRTAYGIEAERVLGGPNWLENDLFDVIAKAPPGTTAETAKPMLQALLAERFQLTTHNDTKSIPAYGLKAGKHPLLKESDGSGDPECKFTPPKPPAPGSAPSAIVLSYSCHNMTMAAFAQALHTTIFVAPQYLNERVVADQTELKGAWDFDFKFTLKGQIGPDGPVPGTITLFDAVEKQLGLKLEPADISMPVVVVDTVNQKPTANAPNVTETLHTTPPPTEFEVADLKPTPPDFQGMRLNLQPGGRVNIAGVPVKFLIQQAWDVTDEMLVGAPKWMDTDRYDIVAKAGVDGPEMDIDALWPMLRALVTERFKMVSHMEQRPATAYTLIAVKPKMKKSEPTTRTKYKEGPASDGKDPRDKNPILGRLVTCQNMTMAQFAEKLKGIAPGYIHSPVLDSTGLEGGYDFTLSFSPAGAVRGGGGRGGDAKPPSPGDAAAAASEPNGAITLFEAMEKQLGLKLEAQKRPVSVLVIDSVQQKPMEN
jgi:uncharacterized protein (TIGR03435 family)